MTATRSFRVAGVRADLKVSGKSDLTLTVSDGPLDIAVRVFIINRVVAAPVVWSRRFPAGQEDGQTGHARVAVLSSGSANTCTRARGMCDAEVTASRAAGLLGVELGQVLVYSTGVIGECIDMPVLLEGVDVAALALADTPQTDTDVATAIMTADIVSKEDALTVGAGEQGWTIGGMVKGVGMLVPGLTTTFAAITADAILIPQQAQDALASAIVRTVNRINSDGYMSINDTVIPLASEASGTTPSQDELDETFIKMMSRLGRRLMADAEGATHDTAITASGTVSEEVAEATARTVSSPNLPKCAAAEASPSWGRIPSQLGAVPEGVCLFSPDKVDVTISGITISSYDAP